LSASQTRTVLSKEDVASRDMLGLNRTSVINAECSSNEDVGFRAGSVHHKRTFLSCPPVASSLPSEEK
jgi:hypothetical protein